MALRCALSRPCAGFFVSKNPKYTKIPMKILKLLKLAEEIETRPTKAPFNMAAHKAAKSNRIHDKSRSGLQGYVSQSQDGHEVVKQNHLPTKKLSRDAFHAYMELVTSKENVFFPRVSAAHVKTDGEYHLPQYHIERLIPISKVPQEILNHLWSLYFDGFNPKKHKINDVIASLADAVATGDVSDIIDQNLKSAITDIFQLRKAGKFLEDIHSNNIMFRFAGGAYQMVITDPIR